MGNYKIYRIKSLYDNKIGETKEQILTNRYAAEKNTCDILTAVHNEGEATRALIRDQETQTLRDKVSRLELQEAMCGVIKYPLSATYSMNVPTFNSNCGCGCGGNYGGVTF